MKRILIPIGLGSLLLAAQGCFNEAPEATAKDKENIERLAEKGIGAKPLDGSAPPKTAEDAQPGTP